MATNANYKFFLSCNQVAKWYFAQLVILKLTILILPMTPGEKTIAKN